jgi:hypothetical protein
LGRVSDRQRLAARPVALGVVRVDVRRIVHQPVVTIGEIPAVVAVAVGGERERLAAGLRGLVGDPRCPRGSSRRRRQAGLPRSTCPRGSLPCHRQQATGHPAGRQRRGCSGAGRTRNRLPYGISRGLCLSFYACKGKS